MNQPIVPLTPLSCLFFKRMLMTEAEEKGSGEGKKKKKFLSSIAIMWLKKNKNLFTNQI